MEIKPLKIKGSYEITPVQFPDSRGSFAEWYRFDALEAACGRSLSLQQANISRSAKGVFRGIHYVDLPGQAKYVTCPSGAVIDFVVDIRVGSPTFGQWDSVLMTDANRKAIFISEGLGHAYLALEPDTMVCYLCSNVYDAKTEGAILPTDPQIHLTGPEEIGEWVLSEKDLVAPTLEDLRLAGKLPSWEEAKEFLKD
jgi:dTDP-4-dehydrorhamnose 3,5-epimerase